MSKIISYQSDRIQFCWCHKQSLREYTLINNFNAVPEMKRKLFGNVSSYIIYETVIFIKSQNIRGLSQQTLQIDNRELVLRPSEPVWGGGSTNGFTKLIILEKYTSYA